jgi:signal transduction histidine kinase
MHEKPIVLPVTEELIGRIGWFIRLRWVAVVGILVFVELGRIILPIQFYRQPIYGILGVLVLYNLVASLVLPLVRRGQRSSADESAQGEATGQAGSVARFLLPRVPIGFTYDREAGRAALFANAQIMVDLVILAALLHFTGGVENPLRVFFVFHVIIASILLSQRATYFHATLGLLLFAVIALGELLGLLPHFSLQGHWQAGGYLEPHLVATQLFLLGVTLYITAYMGTTIAVHLRKREVEVVMLSKQIEEKAEHLQAAYEEVSAAERAKSQYMRKVAHELRGPLGTIKTALNVALESAAEVMADRTLELVQRAEHRAGELATMTQELLSLSRARGGRASVEMTAVDLASIVRRVVGDVQGSADQAGVTLAVSIGEGSNEIMGDPEGLAELVTNLVSNGIRYTPQGGTVTLGVYDAGGTLVINATDTGIGIPEEDLPRIYDEFFRSKVAREFASDGSGLGMAIVKAVVEQHGGSITVKSTLGQGTTVRVELPRAQGSQTATA